MNNPNLSKSLQISDQQFIQSGKCFDLDIIQQMSQLKFFQKLKSSVQNLQITNEFFQISKQLIQFYKFPILLFFKGPIEKILNDVKLLGQYESEIKKIAKLAKNLLISNTNNGEIIIEQLQFLFKKGIDNQYNYQITITGQCKKFMQYIKKLSNKKKSLYKKLSQKQLSQKDIIQFQKMSYSHKLTYLEQNFQNQIKSSIKQLQQLLRKQNKQLMKLNKEDFPSIITNSNVISLNKNKEVKQQEKQSKKQGNKNNNKNNSNSTNPSKQHIFNTTICCRNFFYFKQVIFQPQSLQTIYKFYREPFVQQYYHDLARDICGLLNSSGGNILIGIKQDQDKKLQIQGYTIIQKSKQQFKKQIFKFVDGYIQPSVKQDMVKVGFVPVKDFQDNKYIHGRYIVKVTVKYGERSQFYSYKDRMDQKKEHFCIRMEYQTKNITSIQQVLKMYKQRVINTPPQPKPFHEGQCIQPQIGRPLYNHNQFGRNY